MKLATGSMATLSAAAIVCDMAARLLLPLPEVNAPHPASRAAHAISEISRYFFMVGDG